MILYNVTTKVTPIIHDEWLEWMKQKHIPDVMNTGMFVAYKICRLIKQEEDGTTYAIQYYCKDMATFHKYNVHHAPALREDYKSRYEGEYVIFRTMMEVVDMDIPT